MKTLVKSFFMTLAAVAATSAIAYTPETKIVSFSTENLFYGDGAPVVDGERFALCWSADGSFDGLTADCKAKDADEAVACIVPLAKDGKVPYTVFFIDDGKVGGEYYMYMLDTRDSAGTVATSVTASTVNGFVKVGDKVSVTTGATKAMDGVSTSGKFNVDGFIANEASLTIETVDGAMRVRACNLSPALTYKVKYGKTLNELQEADLTLPQDLTKYGETYIVIPEGEGGFFKLDDPTK